MGLTRRGLLGRAAALGAATAAATTMGQSAEGAEKKPLGVRRGRIRQSIVQWCFGKHWDVAQTAKVAQRLGVGSIELVGPEHFATLKEHGLTCAIASVDMAPDPPFMYGFNNPAFHARVLKATRESIDAASAYGYTNVICFTGFKYKDPKDPASGEISLEQGLKTCVAGLKKVIGYAEKKNITLCLEMLNTRDDTHPMKGHPGYQGDHIDYCADICRAVGSANMKLLFDIYHVQIMDGDVIRRIRQHKDLLGHIHTAGNPGRAELDDTQEINYPAVMKALLEVGYGGFVGQEFIPTRDPLAGLSQAVALCDV